MSENNQGHLSRLGICMDQLEAEMSNAVANDSLYWMKNDAKIRAVQQGVPTYEDFRQLVAGCHLKPLDKSEVLNFNKKSNANWNLSTTTYHLNTPHLLDTNVENSKTKDVINTPQEFYSKWQFLMKTPLSDHCNSDGRDKLLTEMLLNQSGELFEKLFNTGLGVSLLPQIINLLYKKSRIITETIYDNELIKNSFMRIFNILNHCANSRQFEIGLDCLTDIEKQTAFDLFSNLKQLAEYMNNMDKEKSDFDAFYKRYFQFLVKDVHSLK